MEASFLVILTFLFFQIFGVSIVATSSNVTCIEKERESLLLFKQTLTDQYNLLSTWSGVECCGWQGVGCDRRYGYVVKLDLHEKWLEGELSPSLQNLKHLRYLDLSMNYFSSNIPEFLGSFQSLEYLNLSRSSFGGVVPHHLGNLSRLQYLDLSYNFVTISTEKLILDDLGWLSLLSSLRHLDLSGIAIGNHTDWFHPVNMLPSLLTLNLATCDITNIPFVKFINFSSLNSLDLSFNNINSTIPVWLSNLTDLMHLKLQYNYFHGKIPDFLGMFSALTSIDLLSNSFETSMPDLLCNLSSLVRLDLSQNMFFGPIPTSLGLLSRLEDLDLGYNSLVGVLSETHFTKLKNLNYLALSSNSLALNFSSQWISPFQLQMLDASSCNIGPHFPNWLQTQTNLQRLDLSHSSIRDTIPKWFENILSQILYLDLSNNQIGGKLPRLHFNSSNQKGKQILSVNSNKFEGSLAIFPSNVKILDLSDNLLTGHIPQIDETMNPNLEVVNLSKNRFTGSISVQLCKVPSIKILDLSQNTFSGRLPGCLGNLTSLNVIDLSNNIITGNVPSSLGSLKDLISLHLHNNKFEGEIPMSLQNLTKLLTMDLGNNLFMGSIPFWIGEKLSKLRLLNLQLNKFTSKIPLQICQLNALQYLSLAHNNITGTIPRCFRNLSGMIKTFKDGFNYYNVSYYEENILASVKGEQLVYTNQTLMFLTSLDLSNNNIVGEIPDALMNLVGLRNLNLSGNLLKGQIPMTIGNLSQIESLDLSMNMLYGRIPQSLTSLNFLSYLNLSFNNLSGPIPVGNQLQTLNDMSIYEGNNGLCGPPVSRSCNVMNVAYNHVGETGEDEAEDNTERLWFYDSMGPGFIVGFIGLLGSHFIRSWRVAYFETLENVYGWLTASVLPNLARLWRKVLK